MKFKKAFFPTLVILTLFVYSSSVSAQDIDPAILQQVVEVGEEGNPQIKKEYLQQRKETRENVKQQFQEKRNEAIENKENTKEAALEKRDALKEEAQAKKDAHMEQRLEAVTDKFSSRVTSIQERLLNRAETLQSIVERFETNIQEHSDSLDSSVTNSVLSKLDTTSDILAQAVSDIDSLTVSGNYESLDDLKAEGTRVRDEVKSIVDQLKLAKNTLHEALTELKDSGKVVRNNRSIDSFQDQE